MKRYLLLAATASLSFAACGRAVPKLFGHPLQADSAQTGAVDPVVAHYFATATAADTAANDVKIANAKAAYLAAGVAGEGGANVDAGL